MKLHHDNARPHQTKDIKTFLQEEGVMVMPHPSYSLDLVPSDFRSLQQAVTKEIRAIAQDEFRKIFQKWTDRMKLCITNKGEYFEHLMK